MTAKWPRKLIVYSRFLASGQNDPHSATITELCDELERTLDREAELLAQGMSAGTAKTPKAVEGEARQPGPKDRHYVAIAPTGSAAR